MDFKDSTANLESINDELRNSLTVLEVPESINREGKLFKVISVTGFENCTKLESVTFPESVSSVGGFYSCTNLKEVNLPKELLTIKSNAFYGCTELESITLPESLNRIGNNSFYLCTSLKEVVCETQNPIGDASLFFGSPVFVNAKLILKSNESEYKTAPGWSRFYNCVSIDGIYYLLDYETRTAKTTFEYSGGDYNYAGQTSLIIPSEISYDEQTYIVNAIGEGFLSNVSYATSTSTLYQNQYDQSSITRDLDDNSAWDKEIHVTDVELPASIVEICTGAFSYCYVKSIVMKEGIKYIGDEAFADSDIEEIVLPNTIKGIGKEAFSNCSALRNITLGSDLKFIDDRAFTSYDIENVKCLGHTPPRVGNDVFYYNTCRLAKLDVPEEALYDYKVAELWKDFKNIEGFSGVKEVLDIESLPLNSIVDVFDMSGKIIARNLSILEINNIIPSGIYVLKYGDSHYQKYYVK